jgi:GDP-D-mannose dehydratase
MCEFTIPDAAFTTVLVAGATGKVGRILVRKLLLRGYTVKVRWSRMCDLNLHKWARALRGWSTDTQYTQYTVLVLRHCLWRFLSGLDFL